VGCIARHTMDNEENTELFMRQVHACRTPVVRVELDLGRGFEWQIHGVDDPLNHLFATEDAPVEVEVKGLRLGVITNAPTWTLVVFLISWYRAACLEFLPIGIVPLIVGQYVAVWYGFSDRRAVDPWVVVMDEKNSDFGHGGPIDSFRSEPIVGGDSVWAIGHLITRFWSSASRLSPACSSTATVLSRRFTSDPQVYAAGHCITLEAGPMFDSLTRRQTVARDTPCFLPT